jgi:uncharacterized DUF497 family protein
VHIIDAVEVEWHPAKATSNHTKHGVEFAEASVALEDELALTMRDPFGEGEERFITLASDSLGRLLVVVFTMRAERVRIISARVATSRERREYGERS